MSSESSITGFSWVSLLSCLFMMWTTCHVRWGMLWEALWIVASEIHWSRSSSYKKLQPRSKEDRELVFSPVASLVMMGLTWLWWTWGAGALPCPCCWTNNAKLSGDRDGRKFYRCSMGAGIGAHWSGPGLVLHDQLRDEGGAHISHCVCVLVRERGGSPGVPEEASAASRGQPLCPQPSPGWPPPDHPSHALCHRSHSARCVAPGCPTLPGPGGAHAPFRIRRGQHHNSRFRGSLPCHHPPSVVSHPNDPPPGHQPDHLHMGAQLPAEYASSVRLGGHWLWPPSQRVLGGVVLQLVLLRRGVHLFLLAARAHHARMLLDGVQSCPEAERSGASHTNASLHPALPTGLPGTQQPAAAAPGPAGKFTRRALHGQGIPCPSAAQTLPLPLQGSSCSFCDHGIVHPQHGAVQHTQYHIYERQSSSPPLAVLPCPCALFFTVLPSPIHLWLHAP